MSAIYIYQTIGHTRFDNTNTRGVHTRVRIVEARTEEVEGTNVSIPVDPRSPRSPGKENKDEDGRKVGANSYLAGSHRLARYEQLRIDVVQVPLERFAPEPLSQRLPLRYVPVFALRKLRIISPEILPDERRKEGNQTCATGWKGIVSWRQGFKGWQGMRGIIVKKRGDRGEARSKSVEEIKRRNAGESFMGRSLKPPRAE